MGRGALLFGLVPLRMGSEGAGLTELGRAISNRQWTHCRVVVEAAFV
jgi:hypothetical protein